MERTTYEKKQRLTTSSRGDHADTNLAEKLRVEASPKNSSYKIPSGNFTNLERTQSDLEGKPKRAHGTPGENSVVRVRPEDSTNQW